MGIQEQILKPSGFWCILEDDCFWRALSLDIARFTFNAKDRCLMFASSYPAPCPQISYSTSTAIGNSLDFINWKKSFELEILDARQHARNMVHDF